MHGKRDIASDTKCYYVITGKQPGKKKDFAEHFAENFAYIYRSNALSMLIIFY